MNKVKTVEARKSQIFDAKVDFLTEALSSLGMRSVDVVEITRTAITASKEAQKRAKPNAYSRYADKVNADIVNIVSIHDYVVFIIKHTEMALRLNADLPFSYELIGFNPCLAEAIFIDTLQYCFSALVTGTKKKLRLTDSSMPWIDDCAPDATISTNLKMRITHLLMAAYRDNCVIAIASLEGRHLNIKGAEAVIQNFKRVYCVESEE